jgi:predicted small secreted protein
MKRSFLMSALVLALAGALAACGGGGGSGEGAKDATDEKKDGDSKGSDDPVVELKNLSEGIQKDIDALLEPIKNADAVIDGVAKIPADLKAAKSKADPKKILAEVKAKIIDGGGEIDEAIFNKDEEAKKLVTERVEKLKALVKSVKEIDVKAKELGGKITDAITKVPALGGKAIAKVEITLKNPLAGGDAKKKAEEDKKTLTELVDGFKTKATGWQKDITDLPAKAKEIPGKFAKIGK